MKKTFKALIALTVVAAFLVSCASTPKSEPETQKKGKEVKYTYDVLDYPGASRGSDVPAWLDACDAEDLEALEYEISDKMDGKYWIVCSWTQDTKDVNSKVLRTAQEHAQADFARQVARTLSNRIQVTSGESISQDDMQTLTSQASDVNISGFKRAYNGYLLICQTEKATGKEKKYYKVYQIYSIDEEKWEDIQSAYYQKLGLCKELPEDVQKAVKRADDMLKSGDGIKSGFSILDAVIKVLE